MGIGPQPMSRLGASSFIGPNGIGHLPPVIRSIVFGHIFDGIIVWLGKTVPSPLRLCTQWNTVLIKLWKGLQSCSTDRKSKLTIAHRQRIQRVKFTDSHVMASNQCLPIDILSLRQASPKNKINKAQQYPPNPSSSKKWWYVFKNHKSMHLYIIF